MDDTTIAWTDVTWNPIRGCSRVSEGCRNCYAERVAARFSGKGQPYEGLAKMTPSGPRWTGKVRLIEAALDQPLHWRAPRRVFVNSMSDLFHEGVSDAWLDVIFGVMLCARQHTFQALTKRPERMRAYLSAFGSGESAYMELARRFGSSPLREHMPYNGNIAAGLLPGRIQWPLPNVHLGISVEDQATADARIPVLLDTPAAVRWISAEPLLAPLTFRWVPWDGKVPGRENVNHLDGLRRLDWVVVGGESGPGARPFNLSWARDILRQCREAGVPCFIKQLGALPWEYEGDTPMLYRNIDPARYFPDYDGSGVYYADPLTDAKGADPAEWPADLRVQEWPR